MGHRAPCQVLQTSPRTLSTNEHKDGLTCEGSHLRRGGTAPGHQCPLSEHSDRHYTVTASPPPHDIIHTTWGWHWPGFCPQLYKPDILSINTLFMGTRPGLSLPPWLPGQIVEAEQCLGKGKRLGWWGWGRKRKSREEEGRTQHWGKDHALLFGHTCVFPSGATCRGLRALGG